MLRKDRKCSVEGCERPVRDGTLHGGRGMCSLHYSRWHDHGSPYYTNPARKKNMGECSVSGCHSKCYTMGWCQKHYANYNRYGDPRSRDLRTKLNATGIYKREYATFNSMKQRCSNSRCKEYKNYGGRGIKVCDRWLGSNGFDNFLQDMGQRPDGTSLDRIDVNGDYCPENCRWADKHTQANNRRNNIYITYGSETRTRKEWAEFFGISEQALIWRLKHGQTFEQAISKQNHGVDKNRDRWRARLTVAGHTYQCSAKTKAEAEILRLELEQKYL